jgi:hypothetical protein
MPAFSVIVDQSDPGYNRASRAPLRVIGTATAVAATDLFTLTSGSLDSLQSGDVVRIAGTLTGGAGITVGQDYRLERVTSTTFRLKTLAGAILDVTSDLTAGGSLTYGQVPAAQGVLSSNIVPMGSVIGGSQAGPQD